jgi:hypothetical protein
VIPLLIPPYLGIVRGYFRWVKVPLSRALGQFSRRMEFRPPSFSSLEAYAGWMAHHLRWRMDPLWGLLDTFSDLGHMAWQIEQRDYAADDCDGLAYYSAQIVAQFADDHRDIYIVTLVIDPRHTPLSEAAHVECIFRTRGHWRVISSTILYPETYPTFWSAVRENPYCRGRKLLLVEVRDARWRRVPAPPD